LSILFSKKNVLFLKEHFDEVYKVEHKQSTVQNNQVNSSCFPTESGTNQRANQEKWGDVDGGKNTEHCTHQVNTCGQVIHHKLIRLIQLKELLKHSMYSSLSLSF
jgi:hypothetical protein